MVVAQHSTRVLRSLTAGLAANHHSISTTGAAAAGGELAVPNVALASRWAPCEYMYLLQRNSPAVQ